MSTNPHDHEHSSLPSDLEAISLLLDRLASADRASMDDESDHRIASASLGALLHTDDAQQDVHRLAAIDRNAASTLLEERVFEASRHQLDAPSQAEVTHRLRVHSRTAQDNIRRSSFARWSRGLAIAATIALMGGTIVLLIRTSAKTNSGAGENRLASAANPTSMSTADLKAALDRDMESLLSALGETASGQTTSSERQFDPEWIDDLMDGGQSS